MVKISFLGSGSIIFAKNVLGDCMLTPALCNSEIALYDIDEERLNDSYLILSNINKNLNEGRAKIIKYYGVENRSEALRDADFVVNAIQVGGYEPCTVTDFEVPKKYGLRQTIGDSLGIGGIFRTLRTAKVLDDIIADMEKVCPHALFLNYVNPMAMITGYMLENSSIQTVGLCHSVQVCVRDLFKTLEMNEYYDDCQWQIAGINHQSWLLEVTDKNRRDLYPEIKRRAADKNATYDKSWDLVRLEVMQQLGYYVTESSVHFAEYVPWFIKSRNPELLSRFNINLDEYPARCIQQIKDWNDLRSSLITKDVVHHRSIEYASHIMEAVVTDSPYRIHGNVSNKDRLITNLPERACVEVPCLVDRNGITPCHVGDLPEQCAAVNRTNINVQLLTLEALKTRKKEYIYMAGMLDPHTSSELTIDEIKSLCDDLFIAHSGWMPEFH